MKHPKAFILFMVTAFLAVMWPLIRPDEATWAYTLGIGVSLGLYLAWIILVITDKFKNNDGNDNSSNYYEHDIDSRDNGNDTHDNAPGVDLHVGTLPRAARRDEPLVKTTARGKEGAAGTTKGGGATPTIDSEERAVPNGET